MTRLKWLTGIFVTLLGLYGYFATPLFAQGGHKFGQNSKAFGIMGMIQGLGVQVNPTWPFEVGSTSTASSGLAVGAYLHPTLDASANSDVLSALKISPTFTDNAHSAVVHKALDVTGTVYATAFSGAINGSVGATTPSTGAFTNLSSTGTNTLGTGGTAFTAMGVCTIASTTLSTTATTLTCTGVPASASVAVSCSGAAAFSTSTANGVYCQPTGTLSQIACNTFAANTTAMTYKCSWVE